MPPHDPSASWRATIHASALRQRPLPQPLPRAPLVAVEQAVEPHQCPPGERVAGRTGVRATTRSQLVDPERQRAHRAVGGHHGERHDRLARPAGEVVDVERHRPRQQHHLRRRRRQLVPRPQPEQRQPEAGEHTRRLDRRRCRARTPRRPRMCVASRLVTGEAQRDVGLDGRRQVAGTAVRTSPTMPSSPCWERIHVARRRSPVPDRAHRRTGAASGPRRPSSRWCRARPSTSRRRAASSDQRIDAAVDRRRSRRSSTARSPVPPDDEAGDCSSSAATAGLHVGATEGLRAPPPATSGRCRR